MIKIVSATRLSEADFWETSALGRSLSRLSANRYSYGLAFDNRDGLPQVFNYFVREEDDCDTIIFIHDDVWIDDYFLLDRVADGLKVFDVIGLAGNRRRIPFQPSWGFSDIQFTWDSEYISGSIAEGQDPAGTVLYGGPTPAACELLDGVFLATKKSTLRATNTFFDTRFDFHFYDMDFCRTARANGLTLGTWPICLTHQGTGIFGSPSWQVNYRAYLDKWGN